jgi:hypothetical protein
MSVNIQLAAILVGYSLLCSLMMLLACSNW